MRVPVYTAKGKHGICISNMYSGTSFLWLSRFCLACGRRHGIGNSVSSIISTRLTRTHHNDTSLVEEPFSRYHYRYFQIGLNSPIVGQPLTPNIAQHRTSLNIDRVQVETDSANVPNRYYIFFVKTHRNKSANSCTRTASWKDKNTHRDGGRQTLLCARQSPTTIQQLFSSTVLYHVPASKVSREKL